MYSEYRFYKVVFIGGYYIEQFEKNTQA